MHNKHCFKNPLQLVTPSSRCIADWCEWLKSSSRGSGSSPLRRLDGVPAPPWQRPVEQGVTNSLWTDVISKGMEGTPSSLLEQSWGGKCGTKRRNKIRKKNRRRKRMPNIKKNHQFKLIPFTATLSVPAVWKVATPAWLLYTGDSVITKYLVSFCPLLVISKLLLFLI